MNELLKLRNVFIRVGVAFLVATLCALTITVRWFLLFWFIPIPIPSPDGQTIPTLFIEGVRSSLVPSGATLVVSSPLDAFTLVVAVAVAFGGIIAALFALVELWRFVRPGLYPRERRGFGIVLFSAVFLMLSGGAFAYEVVVPLIFNALYMFIPPGVAPLFNIAVIIDQIAGMMFATAVAFLLPIVMALLSLARVVPPSFWRTYARHAFVIVLFASAVITPDGTGISMVILALPICLLYAAGYIVSMRIASKKRS